VTPGSRTEFMARTSVKFSLMKSTVDWMEGSKNPDTCFLRVYSEVSAKV